MKKILIGIVVLVVVVLVGSMYAVPRIARAVVERAGPKVLGVPMHLTSARFDPLKGKITIDGFVMGNPTGFQSKESMGVGQAVVDVKLASLVKDPLVIERIYVSNPRLTYEVKLDTNNFARIQERAASTSPTSPAQAEKPEDAKPKKQKNVIIRDLLIEKGEVHVAVGLAGGVGATLPLPTIHLTNIGNETGGAAVGDILGQVLAEVVSKVGSVAGAVTGAAGNAAKEGAEVAGDAAGEAGDAATEGTKNMEDAAAEAAGKIRSVFGNGK